MAFFITMKLINHLFFLVPFLSAGQSFPKDWVGTYSGTMRMGNQKTEQQIEVELTITTLVTDSLWSYKMTYNAPNGKMEKNYKICLEKAGCFVLDEGGVLIPMLFSTGCFYDFYIIDSMYFNSILSYESKSQLQFNLYGGSLKQNNLLKTSEDGVVVEAFLPNFSQRVNLKRKKK